MTFLTQVIGLAREKPGFFGTKRTVVSLHGIDGDDRKAQITINDPFATGYELGRRVRITVKPIQPNRRSE